MHLEGLHGAVPGGYPAPHPEDTRCRTRRIPGETAHGWRLAPWLAGGPQLPLGRVAAAAGQAAHGRRCHVRRAHGARPGPSPAQRPHQSQRRNAATSVPVPEFAVFCGTCSNAGIAIVTRAHLPRVRWHPVAWFAGLVYLFRWPEHRFRWPRVSRQSTKPCVAQSNRAKPLGAAKVWRALRSACLPVPCPCPCGPRHRRAAIARPASRRYGA